MQPQMTPYTPSLYQPDSYGRYRKYPHFTDTPIPGAGYRVGQLFWGEQELNLDGSKRPQPYGNYSLVPLRGLGQTLNLAPGLMQLSVQRSPALLSAALSPGASSDTGAQGGPGPAETTPEDYGWDVAAEIAAAEAAAQTASQQAAAEAGETGAASWFTQKVGPVPYWAIGLAGLAVVGGGGFLLYRRRKVKGNRRRRR